MTAPAPVPSLPVLPAHGGIEGDWWAAWNADPQVLIPAALVGYWYARGVGRVRGRAHPWWRSALFYAGLAVILLAIESPIDRLGEHHFTFHMVQHELFVLVGVPLLLLGAPTVPLLLGLPRWVRGDLVRPIAGSPWWHRLVRWLTWPPFAIGQFALVLLAWHFAPGWFDAALRNDFVHDVQHVSLLASSALFWWNVIDPAPLRSRLNYGVRMLYIPPIMAVRVLLSAILVFADRPLYDAYAEMTPIIAISRLEDQQLGGLIMWAMPGELLHLAAIGVIFAVWFQKSEAQQREEDEARMAAQTVATHDTRTEVTCPDETATVRRPKRESRPRRSPMTDEGVPGMGPRWWERHRSLATLAAAAVALTVAALVLAGHAITVAESTHRLEGDAAYFGVIATLIVLGAGVVIARQRRS